MPDGVRNGFEVEAHLTRLTGYTVSPKHFMQESRRVCKPGGRPCVYVGAFRMRGGTRINS
jgi:hypothetical protein